MKNGSFYQNLHEKWSSNSIASLSIGDSLKEVTLLCILKIKLIFNVLQVRQTELQAVPYMDW